jgi:xanthine dehydrogenase YagR molybdenum-binding subunit
MIGAPVTRVDAPLKTRGAARYAAEFDQPGMAHVTMLGSTIARGRVTGFDLRAARAASGVLAIITADEHPHPTMGDAVHYQGQTIALVIGETLEASQHAANLVAVHYDTDRAVTSLTAGLGDAYAPHNFRGGQMPADTSRGDPDGAFKRAAIKVEQTYETPAQYHNPMEPHATVAAWDGDHLTVWTATQGIGTVHRTLAAFFHLDPVNVRVICPYVGGGFGSKGNAWPPITLAAIAARRVNRPVRLELTREQLYSNNGYRPETHQTVRLGADAGGKLVSVRHEGVAQMSDPSIGEFAEPFAVATRMLYACPNVATSHRLAATAYGLPTYMRAPGEASGMFALESAMDELAVASRLDPIALRLANHADRDEDSGKPFSSKRLREAYQRGSDAFGWQRRSAEPGSMRDGRILIGWGMATATYPANRMPASARVRVLADGTALVQSATQDLGTGTYTLMTQVAADTLGLPVGSVRAELGDSTFPDAPTSGGSTTAASITPAVAMAAQSVRARLFGLALAHGGPAWTRLSPDALTLRDGAVTGPAGTIPIARLLHGAGLPSVEAEAGATTGADFKSFSRHSFGAQFAEVRVDPDFGTVRVSRFVGAYDAGRILNAKTGRSQFLGGIVFGIGQALHEGAVPDLATGRILNANISDYLVPVNADIGPIDIITVDDDDQVVDPLGARGIGELGIVGAAASVANAVFHATGRRVRRLPIRVEDVLA